MTSLKQNQQGIAAILVSIILVIVIGLIVFSFSEVSRTNQTEALDDQLSQQAYDAAEAAINVTYTKMLAYGSSLSSHAETQSCTSQDGGTDAYRHFVGNYSPDPLGANKYIDPNYTIRVTCVLVNPTPTSLYDQTLNANHDIVWEINPGSTPITHISFNWSGDSSFATTCNEAFDVFPSESSYNCDVPMLQVDLFQDSNLSNPITPNSLNSQTINLFLQPTANSLTTPDTSEATLSNDFSSVSGNPRLVMCRVVLSSSSCTANINIPNGGANIYYVRIEPMYEEATGLSLTAYDSTNTAVPLIGTQALIDATARDQDVARRIQVRVAIPPTNGNLSNLVTPGNAVESTQDICKLIDVISSSNYWSDTCTL